MLMAYVPTWLAVVATVIKAALPVTPDVARVSLLTNPLIEYVSGGFGAPTTLVKLLAATFR